VSANPYRGEANLQVGGETIVIRPSFGALVAAEDELGPLFALVERAADGKLGIGEMAALFDHLSQEGRPAGIDRARIGAAIVELGLAGVSPQLKLVLGQILQGR
jgi:hypothetical protein